MRPSQEFNYERAKQKLVGLDLGEETGSNIDFRTPDDIANDGLENQVQESGFRGRLLRLAGLIDLSSRFTVRSVLAS
jgi:DNA mismatch repair protein MSH5